MSGENEREAELREAASDLAVTLGLVKRDHKQDGRLIDTGEFDEEVVEAEVRKRIDREDDATLAFKGDAALACKWLEKIVNESADGEDF